MRYFILGCVFLSGCAYSNTTITAQGDVYCTTQVEKPVNVESGRGLGQGANVSLVP